MPSITPQTVEIEFNVTESNTTIALTSNTESSGDEESRSGWVSGPCFLIGAILLVFGVVLYRWQICCSKSSGNEPKSEVIPVGSKSIKKSQAVNDSTEVESEEHAHTSEERSSLQNTSDNHAHASEERSSLQNTSDNQIVGVENGRWVDEPVNPATSTTVAKAVATGAFGGALVSGATGFYLQQNADEPKKLPTVDPVMEDPPQEEVSIVESIVESAIEERGKFQSSMVKSAIGSEVDENRYFSAWTGGVNDVDSGDAEAVEQIANNATAADGEGNEEEVVDLGGQGGEAGQEGVQVDLEGDDAADGLVQVDGLPLGPDGPVCGVPRGPGVGEEGVGPIFADLNLANDAMQLSDDNTVADQFMFMGFTEPQRQLVCGGATVEPVMVNSRGEDHSTTMADLLKTEAKTDAVKTSIQGFQVAYMICVVCILVFLIACCFIWAGNGDRPNEDHGESGDDSVRSGDDLSV